MGFRSRLEWSRVYSTIPVEKMNWYYPELDPDLDNALDDYNITSGTFLDLGTGPGTQAIELTKRGFSVTATDISGKAIKLASKLSDEIHFINDDILNSKDFIPEMMKSNTTHKFIPKPVPFELIRMRLEVN